MILLGDDSPWYLIPLSLYCSSTNLRASMSKPFSGSSCTDRVPLVAACQICTCAAASQLVSLRDQSLAERVTGQKSHNASILPVSR